MLKIPEDLNGYVELSKWLGDLRQRGKVAEWAEAMRWYATNDLFFLVNEVLSDGQIVHSEFKTPFYFHPFYIDYCRKIEWQFESGGGVDHSGRGVGKSTLRTKALVIQSILKWPNIAVAIFSFTKEAAKKHFGVIKEEFERNKLLYALWPEVLFEEPMVAAINGETQWSEAEGITVKRSIIRKEPTLSYRTFIKGTPTGGRYDILCMDDVEDDAIVGSKTLLDKLHSTYDSVVHVLTPIAIEKPVLMLTNTMYSEQGLVKRVLLSMKNKDPRKIILNVAEDLSRDGDGPLGGEPIYPYTAEILQKFYDEPREKEKYGLQYLGNPLVTSSRTLNRDWLFHYPGDPRDWGKNKNIYVCIDPSKGFEDPMAIWVWALGEDKKFSWVDGSLKKLDPAHDQFYNEIYMIARKWADLGRLMEIRVEQYGQAMFVEQITKALQDRGFYVPVVKVQDIKNQFTVKMTAWKGKFDRIYSRWAGPAQRGEILVPKPVSEGGAGLPRPDENGKVRCLVDEFIQKEWLLFPKPMTDNLLDAGSLIWESEEKLKRKLQFPTPSKARRKKSRYGRSQCTFMSAG